MPHANENGNRTARPFRNDARGAYCGFIDGSMQKLTGKLKKPCQNGKRKGVKQVLSFLLIFYELKNDIFRYSIYFHYRPCQVKMTKK
jgi:hypothetical protein